MKIKLELSEDEAKEFIFQQLLNMISSYTGNSDEIDIDIHIPREV